MPHRWNRPGLDWAPDGRSLVTADRGAPGQLFRLILISPDGSTRRLTQPALGNVGDRDPVFSPDGKHIAFKRTSTVTVTTIAAYPEPPGRTTGNR